MNENPYSLMNQKDQEFHRSVGRTIATGREIAYKNMQNAARISALENRFNRGSQETAVKTAPAPVRRYADVFPTTKPAMATKTAPVTVRRYADVFIR